MIGRFKGILIITSCLALVLFGMVMMMGAIRVRYGGEKTSALIVAIPAECDRYNSITVIVAGVEKEVNISRADCKAGKFKVGQNVELIVHKDFEEPVWPESRPEAPILIIIGVISFVLFSIRKHLK